MDGLLEIEGIEGESIDKLHPKTIEVESMQWGLHNEGSAQTARGLGTAGVQFTDIVFSAYVNKASAILAMYCATGKPIEKATLFARKQGEGQKDFCKVILEDSIVTSYSLAGARGGGGLPTDQFSLNFAKITYEYAVQKEKGGGLEAPQIFTWDLKTKAK